MIKSKVKILDQDFFRRPTLIVAEELLGKFLICERDGKRIELMIREVEAYDGFEDRASHAHRGVTKRNKVMFGSGGFWYLYFIYGMYWMLNIVTGQEDYPAAILIRGAGEYMGPGKLTKFLGLNKTYNERMAMPESGLWIEDRGFSVEKIQKTPRIGVAYAGKVWAKKLYRFVIQK